MSDREDIFKAANDASLFGNMIWIDEGEGVNEELDSLINFSKLIVNHKLETIAREIDQMKALGDTAASFAALIRGHKITSRCERLGICHCEPRCSDCPRDRE